LTDVKAWDQLEAFSKSKKSPIGYEAFVRHLVSKGHGKQAATYVARCDASKRGDLYAACGDYRAAGREFKERGDKAGLAYVHHSNDTSLVYLRTFSLFRELIRTCPDRIVVRELQGLLTSG
jgi:vacuolar protein sorting-associated protein 16